MGRRGHSHAPLPVAPVVIAGLGYGCQGSEEGPGKACRRGGKNRCPAPGYSNNFRKRSFVRPSFLMYARSVPTRKVSPRWGWWKVASSGFPPGFLNVRAEPGWLCTVHSQALLGPVQSLSSQAVLEGRAQKLRARNSRSFMATSIFSSGEFKGISSTGRKSCSLCWRRFIISGSLPSSEADCKWQSKASERLRRASSNVCPKAATGRSWATPFHTPSSLQNLHRMLTGAHVPVSRWVAKTLPPNQYHRNSHKNLLGGQAESSLYNLLGFQWVSPTTTQGMPLRGNSRRAISGRQDCAPP